METLWHGSVTLVAGINHVVMDSMRQDQYNWDMTHELFVCVCAFGETCS